jgi:hypothetical protein
VRDFEVVDYNSYPVVLTWDPSMVPAPKSGEKESSVEIFAEANSIPSVKVCAGLFNFRISLFTDFLMMKSQSHLTSRPSTLTAPLNWEHPLESARISDYFQSKG